MIYRFKERAEGWGNMTEAPPIICCRLCSAPAVDIYHMPGGCVCAADPVQALCAQHAAKASPLDGMSSILGSHLYLATIRIRCPECDALLDGAVIKGVIQTRPCMTCGEQRTSRSRDRNTSGEDNGMSTGTDINIKQLMALIERLQKAELELAELNQSADLRSTADLRAIKRWQDATGRSMTWPDHADLVVWLLERLEKAEAHEQEASNDKPI